jgi:hypothetical protein
VGAAQGAATSPTRPLLDLAIVGRFATFGKHPPHLSVHKVCITMEVSVTIVRDGATLPGR